MDTRLSETNTRGFGCKCSGEFGWNASRRYAADVTDFYFILCWLLKHSSFLTFILAFIGILRLAPPFLFFLAVLSLSHPPILCLSSAGTDDYFTCAVSWSVYLRVTQSSINRTRLLVIYYRTTPTRRSYKRDLFSLGLLSRHKDQIKDVIWFKPGICLGPRRQSLNWGLIIRHLFWSWVKLCSLLGLAAIFCTEI